MTALRGHLAERLLLLAGFAGALSLGLTKALRVHAQRAADTVIHQPSPIAAEAVAHTGDVVAQFTMPRLGLSVPVLEGCTTQTLRVGSCRVRESAQIGGLGTTGIAAHRDGSFRVLAKVRTGDAVAVISPRGTYHYVVDRTEIVTPDQVQILDAADRPGLALITCYPFHWIGPAPRRFIVEAHLQSVVPSD